MFNLFYNSKKSEGKAALLWIIFVIVVAIAIYLILTSGQTPEAEEGENILNGNGEVFENSITMENQEAGTRVVVSSVTFADSGYVVVHEDKEGSPGPVIGQSDLIEKGEYTDVEIPLQRSSQLGETLYAMLHIDDGDGIYEFPGSDSPLEDEDGELIVSSFVIEEEDTEESSVREITVSGTEFSYNPNSITVSAGEVVKITFVNEGSYGHDLVIDELGISTSVISPGESETIEFTAESQGTYDFYCSVPGHRESGMEGDLMVE